MIMCITLGGTAPLTASTQGLQWPGHLEAQNPVQPDIIVIPPCFFHGPQTLENVFGAKTPMKLLPWPFIPTTILKELSHIHPMRYFGDTETGLLEPRPKETLRWQARLRGNLKGLAER